jgi:hypothetical protein
MLLPGQPLFMLLTGDNSAPECSPLIFFILPGGEESFGGFTTLEEEDFVRSSLDVTTDSVGGGETALTAVVETGVL